MRDLDLAAIFPMNDAASAHLMILKAECLCRAGIISAEVKRGVIHRAQSIIEESECQHAA